MFRKIFMVMFVVVLGLTLTQSALAAAPGEGVVVEGDHVPGIALEDTRAEVEAVNGPPRGCHDINELNDLASCTFDVEGGGWVGVQYRGPNGGNASGSPEDVVVSIRWGGEEVDGWVTTTGISTTLAKYDKQAVIDAYPNAYLSYDSVGRLISLHDPELGIQVNWNHAYIFYTVSMSIFKPYTPPPPPDLMRVADIEMSYNRRSVTARVLVLDEQDQPVEGAVVSAWWVYPINKNNNTNLFTDATTAVDGYAIFRIGKAPRGDYRINVLNVTKEGYEFDYDNSIILGVISKPR
jgi:hypothetical protein